MNRRLLLLKYYLRKMPFYSVARGRNVGVYLTWPECQAQVTHFPRPIFKKFNTRQEAENFIIANGVSIKTTTATSTEVSDNDSEDDECGEATNQNQREIICDPTVSSISRIKALKRYINDLSTPSTSKKRGTSSGTTCEIPLKKPCQIEIAELSTITQMKKYGKYSFLEDMDGYVHVFTDGSCINNGRSSARAGFGVYFAEGHALNTAEPVRGRPTNNCGEIQASSKAIKLANENGIDKLCINTDSQFLINAITKWLSGWKARGWRLATGKPVKNIDDFKELDDIIMKTRINIKWKYVEAHKGILGNERADQLAKEGADMYNR